MAEDAVFLAPAYTFLLRNKPVDVQFWLDIGASGWWERLYQPLTHPFVLSHRWPADEPWTDAEEYFRRQDILRRLLSGPHPPHAPQHLPGCQRLQRKRL